MKFWKYYKMGKFIIEMIRSRSNSTHCANCIFWKKSICLIYHGYIIGALRKEKCKKEIG